jgi:Uma2 family endonuclease
MSGGTYEHSVISLNVGAELRLRLKGSSCQALESNMRIRIPRTPLYMYPDASVVCGEPQFDSLDPNRSTITNPRVVVEVLSPSTEGYDRGIKFTRYRELDSMQEYVLIAQDRPLVETFVRQEDRTWTFAAWAGVETAVQLRSLKIELAMSEIYAGVRFASDSV